MRRCVTRIDNERGAGDGYTPPTHLRVVVQRVRNLRVTLPNLPVFTVSSVRSHSSRFIPTSFYLSRCCLSVKRALRVRVRACALGV